TLQIGLFNGQVMVADEKGYGHKPQGIGLMLGQMATYLPGKNELWLSRFPSKPVYEAMVVHEATHAYFDLHDWDCTTRVAEASAHVVEGWYLWKYGLKFKSGSREDLMIKTARLMAIWTDSKRRERFKKKYPKDWK